MNKILKRLFTGVLTLATVFTALPTTAVYAAETQYWTESEERVGIVERVENNGSISETFNEGHMTVEREDAYCIDINTGFKNGYKTRSDASTRMSAEQIEDVALSLEYVKQYTKNHSGISSQHAYLLRQLVVWQRLSVHLGWSCDNVRASYDEISKSVQDEVFAGAKAFVKENKGRYDCYGYIYTGEGQDLGQFFAELAVGNGKIQKFSSNATVTNGNDCYSLSGATYGVYSDKGCTKSVATLATNANGNTDIVELRAATYYVKETKAPKGFQLDKNVYTMTVKAGETTTLKVSDTPKVTDTLVELFKIDMETSKATPQGNASLEGAEFVWKYYDGYYTKDNLPSEPTRTWTTKTIAEKDSNNEVHYITRLADSYKVSGDSFYTQNGTICLPLGNKAKKKDVLEQLRQASEVVKGTSKEEYERSVGIVTFNINQQNLIDDMLNDACAEDPELESWIYNETEPVFIKNLENVQGDERDVILFSISYGPDEDGKISMNFGPLNREGGWRRLNVAVSRARYEMKVFSSLSADQINLSRTKAEGVVALKEFLEYAAGKTTLLDEITIKGKGVKATGIAGTIKAFLKNNGYESDILVGRSEFKIDVGVINPGNTENYILGIILDGDSYNAAKTTRDRELAQIAVLNGLGWNIHRIWTMDWYDNQVKELNKLLSLLDELKNTSEKKTTGGSLAVTPKTSAVPIQKNVIEKVVTAEQKKKYSAVVYESVVLSYTPMSADNMLDYHSDEIRKRITQIIQKEGPVCEKFLYKKVVQSFGVTRVGSRIQGRLEVLVGNNRDNVTKQESGKVFWPAGINPDNYYGFRASGENENKRDAKDVPVYEALNAMSYILFNDISVEEEDLIREAAKLMGYARVGTGVSTLFKTALKLGCKNGRLIKEDIRWKLTEEGNIFAKNLGSNVVCEEIVSEELNDELDDIDTTTSKLVAKNIKAKEIAKKCALDKITNCDSNCKFYFTCSHAGD